MSATPSFSEERIFDFTGQVAVIIGGTSGLGKAIALGLARAGADVIASSRSQAAVEEVASEIADAGRRTLALVSDVTDRQSLQMLHDRTLASFKTIHILVYAAGITRRIPTLDCSEDLWNGIMDTNLNGGFRSCQIFGRTMIAQAYGRIINIASLSTFVGFHEVAA
jgi:NAD(P)-dependent dehydrogenase (short-subunit alcohol dehydrogenase family)